MAGIAQLNDNEFWDIDSFINWPEDGEQAIAFSSFQAATAADSLLPGLSQSVGLGLAADWGFDPLTTDFPLYDNGYPSPSPTVNYPLAPSPQDFRPIVDSLAAGDARLRSLKEKRRDAAIDFHLQRANNDYSCPLPVDAAASSYAPSSSHSPESLQESFAQRSRSATASFSQTTPGSSSTRSEQLSDSSPSGSLELVLDLNMNAATQLPRKQRKRTKAEIDDYTNVRRHGACIKHKKQHKKCNCLDKIASPAIAKPKTKNRSLDKRAPVRERSLQALEQSSGVTQSVSSQRHSIPRECSQAWLSFGEPLASFPDLSEVQLSSSTDSLLGEDTPTSEQHICVCRSPRCTFGNRCSRLPKEHYSVHPNLWRHGSSHPIETSIHERHIQPDPEPQPGHAEKPLEIFATRTSLDTARSVSSRSTQSTRVSSQGLPESSQSTASVSRGVNGAFHRPPNERQVPSGRYIGSSTGVSRSITHWAPAEMLLEMRSVQETTVVHDRRLALSELSPPQPVHEQLQASKQLAINLSGLDWSRGAQVSHTNTHLPTVRSLSWQASVTTDLIGSYLQVHQIAAVEFGAAMAMVAVTQTILASLFAFVRHMQRIVLLQTWKSLTASIPGHREVIYEAIAQMV